MPIIGTAGHVDHGKSTLVEALTGRDPDRWAVEKQRGLTIDLGFAWTELGAGDTVGFVDVPGHERFVKNMLAGVGGFDIALFVVAADEGWKPQSEEHLAVLDLLDVGHGVIALTRVDLADPDLIAVARSDVEAQVAGTVAAEWEIVEVSAVAGTGLEGLRTALTAALGAAGPPPDIGRPRLWIDRSFVVPGSGVVVTGTLVGGKIAVEDRLVAIPGGAARVRSLQSHEEVIGEAGPGTRVAANLTGVERDLLTRGALLTRPDTTVPTARAMIEVIRAPRPPAELSDRGAYHLHIGTATVPARLRFLGDERFAVVSLAHSLPMSVGDRFILRDTGRRMVAAGGVVLDPMPASRPSVGDAARLGAALDRGPDSVATALVAVHGSMQRSTVAAATGGGEPEGVITAGDRFVSEDTASGRLAAAVELVDIYHRDHPLRPGIPTSSLASQLGIDRTELAALLDEGSDALVDEGATVRAADFVERLSGEDEASWTGAREQLAVSLAVPRASQLGLSADLLHALVRRGDLVQVDSDLVYLPDQANRIVEGLEELEEPFTVSSFRDSLGLSRRQAVPLLEWLDRTGRTTRNGDLRTIRRS
jgi:selenocysteine-specific elongation factor